MGAMNLASAVLPDILLVDDDPGMIQLLSRALAGLGRLRFATSGLDALRLARAETPDLLLLDAEMPGMSGFELWEQLRADPRFCDLPMIFVTSHDEEGMEERGLAVGAADFIVKPVRPGIVAARVRTQLRLKAAVDSLRRLAATDSLTGLANRRVLVERIAHEWARARRMWRPLAILLLDVDYFKRYNDCYGHLRGDEALVAVTRALSEAACRPADLVARYGGEEFAVLLPDTDRAGAEAVAQDILERMPELGLVHAQSDIGHLSVSIGGACWDVSSTGWRRGGRLRRGPVPAELPFGRLLAVADEALYRAKREGRARACFVPIDLGP